MRWLTPVIPALWEAEGKQEENDVVEKLNLFLNLLQSYKEWDGMWAILGSYDSELTPAKYSPQLTRCMREAEDMVQKVHSHSTEIEAQLSQALEELGGQKQRADMDPKRKSTGYNSTTQQQLDCTTSN
ncbi:mitotic spindle assembly checkpoint protein MAD1-like isoform X2 [Aotus nancymaae]|uniref:mitotic spindle assembly checkpoint protein MAD1-like isoform X2 n=1 Tax=Aotus nancymaae TaxID=37293 RepID=UPI000625EBC0|nr:mitotic spindle assembly checkpoint protein MAD1-like isoform X2 [Aotus nancymaae]